MLVIQLISTSLMWQLSLHVASQEMEMGMLLHNLSMLLGEKQTRERLKRTGWSLREDVKMLSAFDDCPTPDHIFLMNIIVWNCIGTLKPSFQKHVGKLVRNHNLAMLVIMKICVGGDRAKEITNRLPFDSSMHMDTIGYAGGL